MLLLACIKLITIFEDFGRGGLWENHRLVFIIRNRTDILQNVLLHVRSCDTLVLGAEEVSRQASQLDGEKSPDPVHSDSEFLGFHYKFKYFADFMHPFYTWVLLRFCFHT